MQRRRLKQQKLHQHAEEEGRVVKLVQKDRQEEDQQQEDQLQDDHLHLVEEDQLQDEVPLAKEDHLQEGHLQENPLLDVLREEGDNLHLQFFYFCVCFDN